MEIDKDRLTKEIEKLEYILGRKHNKKGYEQEFQNIETYEELLLSIGGYPKGSSYNVLTYKQLELIDKLNKREIRKVCDFYNQNNKIIQEGFNNFENMLKKDDIFLMTPTYSLKKISPHIYKELLLEYYSQYGDNIYKIIRKYIDEKRIHYGNILEPGAGGMYLSSKITKSGYVTIEECEKLTMMPLITLVHELGHAIDAETFKFPQSKNIDLLSDLFIEVPSIHFEMGFIDFLINNNIYPKDAHVLLSSRYQEFSFLIKSFDILCNLEDFYVDEDGYVSNLNNELIDYEGKKIEESCHNETEIEDENIILPMNLPEIFKYGLGTYIASQTNELASQDRKAYIKDLLNFTTQRKESSFIESLERLGISEEQFASSSIIEPRIQKELMYTKKMWNFK